MKNISTICATFLAVFTMRTLVPAGQAAPSFDVDPLWPKPLPNHWLLGSVTGVAVDAQDHIWVVHRGYDSMTARTEIGAATTPKTSDECCVPAPHVLEFDAAGNLLGHWGGPGEKYDWPVSPGGIAVDANGSVWLTAAGPPEIPGSANASSVSARGTGVASSAATQPGRGTGRGAPPPKPVDAHVLKFSRKGEFLLQIGKAGAPGGIDSTTGLNRPFGIDVDPTGSEVYVADGYANRRVVVFDASTGAYKRHFTGPGEGFKNLSCAKVAKDGTVYVCDRGNNRVQAFDKTGKFLKQGIVSPSTLGTGSVWDIALSKDPQQRFLF